MSRVAVAEFRMKSFWLSPIQDEDIHRIMNLHLHFTVAKQGNTGIDNKPEQYVEFWNKVAKLIVTERVRIVGG